MDTESTKRLVAEALRMVGSQRELLRRLQAYHNGLDAKTLGRWLAPDDDRPIKTHHVDAIVAVAEEVGVPVERFCRVPVLWDLLASYADNRRRMISVPPFGKTQPNHRIRVEPLGVDIRSPWGAAPSPLTCRDDQICYLARAGNSVITFKTVRSRQWDPLPSPNMAVLKTPLAPLSPKSVRDLSLVVVPPFEGCSMSAGGVNSWGMASDDPEEWTRAFQRASECLAPGQVLILSVVGSADKTAPRQELIDDFVAVVRLALRAGASIIELNLSCPNCYGQEGEVYRDLALSADICRAVRTVANGHAKILVKIGYMSRDALESFVTSTVPFVDGYSLINTLAVGAVLDLPYGPRNAFGDRKQAGLSGAPLLSLGLDAVRNLVTIREGHGGKSRFAIVAIGGVRDEGDVIEYLKSGADIVQAASIFFDDAAFGLKVQAALQQYLPGVKITQQDQEEAAFSSLRTALQRPALRDRPGAKRAGLELLLAWCENNEKDFAVSNRRARTPTPEYWEDRILKSLTGRGREA